MTDAATATTRDLTATGPWRTSPRSPVVQAVEVTVGVLVFALLLDPITELREFAAHIGPAAILSVNLGLPLVVFLLVLLVCWMMWRRRAFGLAEEELRFEQGLLEQRRRTARYDRIHAVDVNFGLVARIFGVGELVVETAGGDDSKIRLRYLTRDELDVLHDALMARCRAAGAEPEGAQEMRDDAPADAETTAAPAETPGRTLLAPLPAGRLLGSIVLSPLVAVGLLTVAGYTGQLIAGEFNSATWLVVIGAVAGFATWLNAMWRQSLTVSGDDLEVTAGLYATRRQTVPVYRLHAFTVVQPRLWRRPGWSRLLVNIAGYGKPEDGEGKDGAANRLIPVAPDAVTASTCDTLLDMQGARDQETFATAATPRQARLASPIDWSRQAVALSPAGVTVTWGRVTQRRTFVPWAHVQGMRLTRGPVERALGVATIDFAVVAGPVSPKARQLATADALAILAAARLTRVRAAGA